MDAGCPRAWAGAPRCAIPNDSIEIGIDRRAGSRRGDTVQGEFGPTDRDHSPSRRHVSTRRDLRIGNHNQWLGFGRPTLELSCERSAFQAHQRWP